MNVRVSIANLVVGVIVPGRMEYVGILSCGAYNKLGAGMRLFQPIGGAVELAPSGKTFLEQNFQACNFHISIESGIDARFEIDDRWLEQVFAFFQQRDPEMFEINPRREIIGELSTAELTAAGGLPALPPILTPEQAESIAISYSDTVIQPFTNGPGTSILSKQGLPSRRMFHRFIMRPPKLVYPVLRASSAIRILRPEEVLTTDGGRQKGVTDDGVKLADNFIL